MTLPRGPASRRLIAVTRQLKEPRLSIGAVVDALGAEGLGIALLVFSLPALVPAPGPVGATFGTLVALLAFQIMAGSERLWLPARWRSRKAPRETIRKTVMKALPWIGRIETVLKEGRLAAFTGRQARIAFALPILLMAVIIWLPIPFGNFAPAIALVVLAMGFIAHDGLAVVAGLIAMLIAVALTAVLFVFGTEIVAWLWALTGW
jgi:hypothetical protein